MVFTTSTHKRPKPTLFVSQRALVDVLRLRGRLGVGLLEEVGQAAQSGWILNIFFLNRGLI